MDHGTDPPLHLHQHRHGQRPQRLGPTHDAMPSPSGSLPQHASSPSSSAAASPPPSYFVRSHQAHDVQPDDAPVSSAPTHPCTPATDAVHGHHEPKHQRDQGSVLSSHTRASSSTSTDGRDGISVAIKCPSLDKDSAVIRASLNDTVLSFKRNIERTWPGAPRADGMRCIRSGRILQDSELLAQLAQNVSALNQQNLAVPHPIFVEGVHLRIVKADALFLTFRPIVQRKCAYDKLEQDEPLSLHLVIRPDAWTDPQNRPTPSRRSSYLRHQQQQQLLEQQLQNLPRSALANEVPLTHHADLNASSLHVAASTQSPSRPTRQFEPYFSDPPPLPSSSSAASQKGPSPLQTDGASSLTSRPAAMPATARASQASADAHAVLEQTLRVTAPQNWPLLVQVLESACDEYILMYEAIYNQAMASQKLASGRPDNSSACEPSAPSELLTDVEVTLLGWNPVALPGADSKADSTSSSQGEMQYLYQQVSHRGLPYLLRISSQPIDVERSEALNTLLERITILRSMIDKIDNIIRLGSLFGTASSAPLIGRAGASSRANDADAARFAAPQQRGRIARTTSAVRDWIVGLRTVTLADVTAVLVPMFFVGLKVGLLLSVMLPGADTVKRYFVIGMAAVYVVFESFRIVQRRERARQRMQPRQAPPRPPVADAGGAVPANQNPAVGAENQGAGVGADVAAPAGANVPSAPSHEQQVERQAAEEPLRPLPPPQAPARFRSRSRFTYDWWIDHMAFIGLDLEDAELGLLPPPTSTRGGVAGSSAQPGPPRADGWATRVVSSSWVVPVVLFVVTMMPEVEQRRKRAIEERERVIRKWTRLEHERRERAREILAQQAETDKPPALERVDGQDTLLQAKRTQYADRIARQRRTTEAVDVDPDDLDARAALAAAAEEDDDDFEDMNIF